jgi:hypothetical protein
MGTKKRLFIIYAYCLTVLLGPFIIMVVSAEPNKFQMRDATIFICGVLATALSDNFIDQVEDNFSRLRHSIRDFIKGFRAEEIEDWGDDAIAFTRYTGGLIVTVGLLVWNIYFLRNQPIKSWAPLVAFFLAFCSVPYLRFIFTEYD